MPCRDYYDDHPAAYFRDVTEPALKKQISFAESALCATLAAFEKTIKSVVSVTGYTDMSTDPLDFIDYKEAGITRADLQAWHKNHKKLDAKHRAEEQARLKAAALAKLTPEERKALGH